MTEKPKRKVTPNTWVKLAHDFHTNHKILSLAHDRHHRAIAAYACGLSWCGENKTDGWIPAFALPQIHANTSDAAHLVSAGLWRSDAGGWWVNDWEDWQETNSQRAERTERMRGLANIKHHGHPDGPGPTVSELDARRNA